MEFCSEDIKILSRLIGPMSDEIAAGMKRHLECFLHPRVSLFIPAFGQCDYAVTRDHKHPAYTFIYYFQPADNVIVEGKRSVVSVMDGKCLTAMSPEIRHQEMEEEHFQSYIAAAIDKELFENTALQYTDSLSVFKGEAYVPHPELLNMMRCFILAACEDGRNPELLENLAVSVAHLVAQSILAKPQNEAPFALYDRFEVDRAVAYMNSHFPERISVEDIAEYAGLSADYFSRLFKSVTRQTPVDFLNSLRLQKARVMMLNQTGNMTDIALQCGFNSSSYFSACFIKKYHMTPTVYRQNVLHVGETTEI